MTRFLLVFFFAFFGYAHSQDTLAVRSIAEAISETEKGNFISLGLIEDNSKSWPIEFFKIPKNQIVGLVIDNCHYTSIPQLLMHYENIEYFRYSWFYFADCPLTAFPSFIPESKSLNTVIIEGAKLTEIPSLSKLEQLEMLKIYSCSLPDFPKEVLELKNLKHLNLACNDFTSIPNDIDRLSNLISLAFEGGACGATPIASVPSSIGNLTKLESFSIGYTEVPIKTLPDSFYELVNLREFECHGCGMESISENLGKFKKLEYLQLTNLTYFEELPEAFFTLPNLKHFRFYQYGPKADPELLNQKERINEFGKSLEGFDFDIRVSD